MNQPPTSQQTQHEENWSHVSETVNMLYLAVCQIETTMNDANTSVDTLTQSFTQLAGHTCEVGDKAQNIQDVKQLESFKQEITKTTDEIQLNISRAVEAFQFYDRVCQRVDHVARSLEKVSSLLEDGESLYQKNAWTNVQNTIKSSYTMEAERIMFEFIMRGGSVSEALKIYHHHFSTAPDNTDDSDEIELF